MGLRYHYLYAGIAWALLLGPLAFLLLIAFAVGVSWLWLFGDSPWRRSTLWILPLIGAIGGVAAASLCVTVAYRYGRRREGLPRTVLRGEHWKVLFLATVPLLLLLAVGVGTVRQGREYTEAMNAATQREAAFAELMGARHRITGLTVERTPDDGFRATVQLAGNHEGEYRLRWHVADRGIGANLATGEQRLHLRPGPHRVDVTVSLDELARGYREIVLRGKTGVLVDEPFRLDVSLDPIFGTTERDGLPPGERRRLETGESPLRSSQNAPFTGRFVIENDGAPMK